MQSKENRIYGDIIDFFFQYAEGVWRGIKLKHKEDADDGETTHYSMETVCDAYKK